MSISLKEDWDKYQSVWGQKGTVPGIEQFRTDLEEVIIPALSEIGIKVNINSASTLSRGEVTYEAFVEDDFCTISFRVNKEAEYGEMFAEMYTFTNSVEVGEISMNDLEEVKAFFLDAAERLGLDIYGENKKKSEKKDKERQQELLDKMFKPKKKKSGKTSVVTSKTTPTAQKDLMIEPKVDDKPSIETEPEEKFRTIQEVYPDAINVFRNQKLNCEMQIWARYDNNENNFTNISCYKLDYTKCLVDCSKLGLDGLVTYEHLGKYLADLDDKYAVTYIIVFNEDKKVVFEEDIGKGE